MAGVDSHAGDRDRAATEAEVRRDVREGDARALPTCRAITPLVFVEPREEITICQRIGGHSVPKVGGTAFDA